MEDVIHPPEVPDGDHDVWVILIELDYARGFQKYILYWVLSEKWWSGTSSYLEDVFHPPEIPDGCGHLH